ncbi:transmembrane protein 116 isoform X1 [Nematostella vectensis]|uniref:transmembrane protein 116 isoform X1 n=1 Tax=Nematostella vectensis TaxID=45351 RepID=UPI00138FE8A6|nr:transmembrane protein 116 isoform X1 [Nematostella vectensis]
MRSPLEQGKMEVLAYIYMCTATLSIIGAASIVLAAVIKHRVANSEVRPIFHLSLSDLVASVFLLIGAILFCNYKTTVNENILCSYFTALTSSFYMSTFLLTVLYAFEVYGKLKNLYPKITNIRQDDTQAFGSFHQLFFLYTFAWALPLAITLSIFAVDSGESGTGSLNDDICGTCLPVFHYRSENCSLSTDNDLEPDWNHIYKSIFIAMLSICMLAIVVIYILALKLFRKIQVSGGIIGRQQYEQQALVRRRACIYFLVFIACWLPGTILGILSLKKTFELKKYFVFYVIQALSSPLQGFINCLVYGWRRPGFMRSLRQTHWPTDPYS